MWHLLSITYSNVKEIELVDTSEFTHLNKWFANMKKLVPKFEEINGKGTRDFAELFWKNSGTIKQIRH